MAKTKNNIYYPDNYDEVADIPSDLKKIAESIDQNIELINSNIDKKTKAFTVKTENVFLNANIAEQTVYRLPLSYTVGNDSLKIHWQGVLLEQGEEGNYIEVGEPGQVSNEVRFGWNLEAGETLIIEVRGDTNE